MDEVNIKIIGEHTVRPLWKMEGGKRANRLPQKLKIPVMDLQSVDGIMPTIRDIL